MITLFKHELKYYFKSAKEAIYIYGLFASIILLAPFGLHEDISQLQELGPIILWIALASMVSLGGIQLFQRDRESGNLEYYQLLPISLEGVLLAKWGAFFCFMVLPPLTLMPAIGTLMGIKPELWRHYVFGLCVGTAALCTITSLVSALMAGLEKAGAIASLIVLPLSVPVMIFGTYYCAQTDADWQLSMLFLGGFTLFLLPVYCLAGAACIRASN